MFDLNKEREAFEAWLINKFDLPPKSFSLDFNDGVYDSIPTQARWEAWKERAKAQAVPDQIINEIQAWIAKESFMSYEAFDGLFVVGANEIAEFIEQLVKSESGAEG
ncbi:hypothetical protein OHV84_18990 [Acinetobacter baumannii]|uniref:hypothetical protein n=1 Tax=Acinetobacter baumannii TaxID=470 RepID=UPI00207B7B71|nr:hypothetical protein [Acinetobacter baumannii]MDC4776312.1 hypothetical protein [Acinetobacter baumannii]MDC4874571.1 hypothetical protein [Acinetobacter baumannii]MDC4887278.1 hypothetical protein [Acinetobacter baumannii]MDC4926093.1 hypothetical protein [Acinetobacter baumannii]MDC4940615.1 hypothetical protein [Acinetobacter baumannii]